MPIWARRERPWSAAWERWRSASSPARPAASLSYQGGERRDTVRALGEEWGLHSLVELDLQRLVQLVQPGHIGRPGLLPLLPIPIFIL